MLTYLKLESRMKCTINYECTALTNCATGPTQLCIVYCTFENLATEIINFCSQYVAFVGRTLIGWLAFWLALLFTTKMGEITNIHF